MNSFQIARAIKACCHVLLFLTGVNLVSVGSASEGLASADTAPAMSINQAVMISKNHLKSIDGDGFDLAWVTLIRNKLNEQDKRYWSTLWVDGNNKKIVVNVYSVGKNSKVVLGDSKNYAYVNLPKNTMGCIDAVNLASSWIHEKKGNRIDHHYVYRAGLVKEAVSGLVEWNVCFWPDQNSKMTGYMPVVKVAGDGRCEFVSGRVDWAVINKSKIYPNVEIMPPPKK